MTTEATTTEAAAQDSKDNAFKIAAWRLMGEGLETDEKMTEGMAVLIEQVSTYKARSTYWVGVAAERQASIDTLKAEVSWLRGTIYRLLSKEATS